MKQSRNKFTFVFIMIVLLLIFFAYPAYAVDDKMFSCYVIDRQDCRINSYYAEEDGIYYLFLTSKEVPDDVVLYVDDSITTTSAGMLDEEHNIISGAFTEVNDIITLTDRDGGTHQVKIMQSNLPSLYIQLNDVDLEELHQDKTVKYSSNTLILTDPSNDENSLISDSIEIKGRGNSTWQRFEKKPYQIKFAKNNQF